MGGLSAPVPDVRYEAQSGLQLRSAHMSAFDPKRTLETSTQISGYSPDSMARSSRKRIPPLLLPSEITKRTRPCLEVSA
jgi:hypothetical protein